MVIGERFAWAHIPKTGGNATIELLRLFPVLIVFSDTTNTSEQHTPFRDRADQIAGKRLAMNLRRLPFWALSQSQHVARFGRSPRGRPLPMESPKQLSESSFPDRELSRFIDNGRLKIDSWLRMEFLADDFLAFISAFIDVTEADRERVLGLGPVNAHDYDHEAGHWFTPNQIETMYETNPVWAALEQEVYGDLFRLG